MIAHFYRFDFIFLQAQSTYLAENFITANCQNTKEYYKCKILQNSNLSMEECVFSTQYFHGMYSNLNSFKPA